MGIVSIKFCCCYYFMAKQMRKGNKVQVKSTTEMKYGPFLTDNYAIECKQLYHQQLYNYMLPFFLDPVDCINC